jgi:hypothetical protein
MLLTGRRFFPGSVRANTLAFAGCAMITHTFYRRKNRGKTMNIDLRRPVAMMVLVSAAAAGCTWVDPKPGASSVTLVMPTHVSNCKPLGTTISQVKDKIGIINRSDEKVAEELLTLAKNSAVDLGGDTLVAEDVPNEGTQKFKIYKCP